MAGVGLVLLSMAIAVKLTKSQANISPRIEELDSSAYLQSQNRLGISGKTA